MRALWWNEIMTNISTEKFVSIKKPLILVCLLGVAGCRQLDPVTQQGHWTFTGANDANLRAQIANVGDLTHGQSSLYSDGQEATIAIERWRGDRVKSLQQSGISDLKTSGSDSSNQPASAPSAGADGSVSGSP